MQIPLPPLPTQHAIVTRIETLFAELDKAVQHLRTAQQQLKTYRQAVLKAAFEGCDKYEKIIKHFDVTGGLTKNSQREKFPVKMPYLRVANVYYNRLDLSEIKEIGVQESEIKEKLLKKDDLLFVEGNGSKEQIGRVAIWNGSIENCLHQNHIIKGRPLGTTLSKFALYYFISDFGREQILKVASSTSGLYTLSTEKVRNLKVPSCSLTEQHRIVQEIESRLSQATASETYIGNALQQAEALRQSILKKAFSGEFVSTSSTTTFLPNSATKDASSTTNEAVPEPVEGTASELVEGTVAEAMKGTTVASTGSATKLRNKDL